MKTAVCKSCHGSVIWTTTVAGKKMPIDALPTEHGNIWIEMKGDEVIAHVVSMKAIAALGCDRYVSHFASCRDAQVWRGKTR